MPDSDAPDQPVWGVEHGGFGEPVRATSVTEGVPLRQWRLSVGYSNPQPRKPRKPTPDLRKHLRGLSEDAARLAGFGLPVQPQPGHLHSIRKEMPPHRDAWRLPGRTGSGLAVARQIYRPIPAPPLTSIDGTARGQLRHSMGNIQALRAWQNR